MAQHGYLHDSYDGEDFGRGDDDRERGWRDREDRERRRGRDEERGWNERYSGGREHNEDRRYVFGGWGDDSSRSGSDDHRGFLERAGERVSGWFSGDDDRDGGSGGGEGQGRFGGQGDWSQGRQSYSAHPDDHYRSWREKQMQALDRDYQDYCREREQQFHSEFDSWRRNRQGESRQSSSQASDQAASRDNPAMKAGGEIPGATSSPMGAATMGTNNSENSASESSATGRGRR